MGTREAASIFTIFSVLLSTLFISMNAAQIFGTNDAVLEPSSRPAICFGSVTLAPGFKVKMQ
jgi:hypothetical protein